MTLALAVLVASLVGSPHCAAMCGGFVCFYAGGGRWGSRRHVGWAAHSAYNGGRLVSYTALGLLAGSVGAGLDAAGRLAGLSRMSAIVAGALMVGWGLARLAALRGVRLAVPGAPASMRAAAQRAMGSLLRRTDGAPPVVRAGATGLLTTLLPCGWLYTFVATAAATGSAAGGALVMFAFWAGTLPMMVAVGLGAQRLAGPLAARLPVASALLIVALGLLSIAGRLNTTLPIHAGHAGAVAATGPQVLGAATADSGAIIATDSAHIRHTGGHGTR